MENLVKVKSETDGAMVEFVYDDPKVGGVKDVYFNPDKKYVVAFFRNGLDSTGRERIEKLVGAYRKGIFEKKGGEYFENLYRWPDKIVEYDGMTGIVVPFYDPKYFFKKDSIRDGVEKDGYWFASGKNFNNNVPDDEKGSLLTFMQVCLCLSRATKRLHAAGLAHSDLSYKNCLIDPSSGDACMIDIDGLVVPGLYPPDVIGTRDLIAPEVVASSRLDKNDPKRVLPSIATDRHALSVLIYTYLFHRHPLRGSKVWDIDSDAQEFLEMGEKAIFVENPNDPCNKIKIDKDDKDFLPWLDADKLPYVITGPYLKDLFEKSFISGLHSPNLRPTANDWEDGLVKTLDLIKPCSNLSCVKKWYVFDGSKAPVCPYCGSAYHGQIPRLSFSSSRDGKTFFSDNHELMVFNGLYLYQWHVNKNIFPNERITEEEKKPVGYFTFYNNQWLFVNLLLPNLVNITENKKVPITTAVALKNGMTLNFSNEPTTRRAAVNILNF
jgi:serine/threonine protein kinase